MKRFVAISLLLWCILVVKAQESANYLHNEVPSLNIPVMPTFKPENLQLKLNPNFDYKSNLHLSDSISAYTPLSLEMHPRFAPATSALIFDRNPFARDWNSSGIITSWYNGYVFGAGGYNTYTGIGSIGEATIGFSQTFDKVTITGSVTGNKYNMAGGVYDNFGANAMINYQINDRFSLNVFGSAQTNNSFYSGGSMGVLPYSSYGASLTTMFSRKFGADVGMQRCFDPYSRQWKNIPIVSPFFNWRGQKIGFDLGPLLLNIFEGLNETLNGKSNYGPPNQGSINIGNQGSVLEKSRFHNH